MLKLSDQFDFSTFPLLQGFNYTTLRKNPNSNGYQYKIGRDAKLYATGFIEYKNIKPKKPGEWIDFVFNGEDLYLYLECKFRVIGISPDSGEIMGYKIDSAELKLKNELPQKFTGDYTLMTNTSSKMKYYQMNLGRKLLAIIPDPQQPIQICTCASLDFDYRGISINGINKPRL